MGTDRHCKDRRVCTHSCPFSIPERKFPAVNHFETRCKDTFRERRRNTPFSSLETHNLLRCLFDPYQMTICTDPEPMCKSHFSAFPLQYIVNLDMPASGTCRHTFDEDEAAILSYLHTMNGTGSFDFHYQFQVSKCVVILYARPSSH